MKVLVIPENPKLDQYILKPIAERMLEELKVTARVDILTDPHLRGVDEALDSVDDIIVDNPMVDLFLLMIDRDCDRFNNTTRAQQCQTKHAGKLITVCAREEVEMWMLALHRDELPAGWSEITAECDPKERYAEPFLQEQSWTGLVGKGRKRAMRALGASFRGLLTVCPELAEFRDAVQDWLKQRAAS